MVGAERKNHHAKRLPKRAYLFSGKLQKRLIPYSPRAVIVPLRKRILPKAIVFRKTGNLGVGV
jgi:hypothetical protein